MTRAPQLDGLVSDPVFPVTFRAFSEGMYGHGVIAATDLEATDGTGDFEIDVAPGSVIYDGTLYELATVSTVSLNAPNTDPRWDLIYFDTADQTVNIRTGSPSVTPQPGDLQSGEVMIAYIVVMPDAEFITDSEIRNWRARPQPAKNTPFSHADLTGDTVQEALDWLYNNKSSNQHDHSGETINPDDVNASTASVDTAPSSNTDVVRKTETDALDTRVGDNETTINDHESRISDNETAISDHESRVSTNESNISSNDSDITSLNSRLEIDGVAAATRQDLPDPTTLDNPMIGYIEEEDRYVGVHQE